MKCKNLSENHHFLSRGEEDYPLENTFGQDDINTK